MRFRHVEAFRAVMQTRSVTRAAELLHSSQPTISRYVQELERDVGFDLFLRSSGKLRPTPEGQALYAEVERCFSGLSEIEEKARGIAAFSGDRLRISSISAIAVGVLAEMLPRFHQIYPNVELRTDLVSFEEVVRNVASHQSEIGFVAYNVDIQGLSQTPILNAQAVCILPRGHRLASQPVIDVTDLEGESFVSIRRDAQSGVQLERIFAEAGVNRRIVVETQNAALACEYVKRGLGVSIVDPLTALSQQDPCLVRRKFLPVANFHFSVLVRTDRALPRVAQRFVDFAQEVGRSQLARAVPD